ncbi:DUF3310 domain-containing protein [Vibrio vulnificus]|uniref:DUF3310 domain-containing protein n=1 Tax=Vibrio vulnificus TaxID=672 RepID=UPI0001F5BDED|nr:DUF3310 domain-containing protein [Vibrio vulnificus]ADV88584.1 hypothetical protein VVMO6_03562 [Vibrio vulnificus MO6-24/O]
MTAPIYSASELAFGKLVNAGDSLVCRESYSTGVTLNELVKVTAVLDHGLNVQSSTGIHFVGRSKFSIVHSPSSDVALDAPASDPVHHPKHYEVIQGVEAKDIIQPALDSLADKLTPWQAYCLGNILKYRLRAGSKDKLEQDINKALKYKEMATCVEG